MRTVMDVRRKKSMSEVKKVEYITYILRAVKLLLWFRKNLIDDHQYSMLKVPMVPFPGLRCIVIEI